jgi:sulfate adenylyltransferase subunit 2
MPAFNADVARPVSEDEGIADERPAHRTEAAPGARGAQEVIRQFGHLDALESEAIHIMREVAAECANPALLFSGGKERTPLSC